MNQDKLLTLSFLLVASTNLCLFLILASWSFLPLFIIHIGGDTTRAGLVMGSLGIATLGALPFLAPLIDRYGRKTFICGGALLTGLSNACFPLFDSYSPALIIVRLFQGIGFAACFNGCSTAVIDLVPAHRRAQGIGLFGVSSSIAVALGPFVAETVLLGMGFDAYFLVMVGFGLVGFFLACLFQEPPRRPPASRPPGLLRLAVTRHYRAFMVIVAVFGSGFAAMNTFFPLFAVSLGLRAAPFFVSYGVCLLLTRVMLGRLADWVSRDSLILVCLIGYGCLHLLTAEISLIAHTIMIGGFFGLLQGLAYPAMMARILERSTQDNRAVVVALFTGSFGLGINASVPVWGYLADLSDLAGMYQSAGILMLVTAAVSLVWAIRRRLVEGPVS